MTNIITFPSNKILASIAERIKIRNGCATLVNSTQCNDRLSKLLVLLIETIDKNNHQIIKMELKKCVA